MLAMVAGLKKTNFGKSCHAPPPGMMVREKYHFFLEKRLDEIEIQDRSHKEEAR